MRHLGAVGTMVWDKNRHPSVIADDNAPLQQWGGAIYSLSSLAAACPAGWVIDPIVNLGRDLAAQAILRIESLPAIGSTRGLKSVQHLNNRVELVYRDAGERDEILTGGVPPWKWEELKPLLSSVDALYVNFISGHELTLETAKELRRSFDGLIYADLHSLFLGEPAPRGRPPRLLPRWSEWVACFDVVQLNEVELSFLAGDTSESLPSALLDLGPGAIVVTLGPRGVRYAARRDLGSCGATRSSGPVREGIIEPPLGPLEGDPTGCGDVFGGALMAGITGGLPLEEAIERAQRFAAAKMLHPATEGLVEAFQRVAAENPNR